MRVSKGFLYASGAAIFWGIAIVLLRFLLKSESNPFNIAFWSTILQLPYWIYVFSKQNKEFKKTTRKDKALLLLMALISSVGVGIAEVLALKFSPSINYSLLIRTVTVFTVIFAFIFLDEKITKKKIFLTFFILLGSYFLVTNGKEFHFSLGDIFTISEAILLSIGNNVLGKITTNRMSTTLSSSASFVFAFIPNLLIAYFFGAIFIPQSIPLLILLAFSYILIRVLRFEAYKLTSASYVTMIFSFSPVVVAFLAIPLLGESMSPIQILGGVLIITAGVLVEKLKI